MKQTQKRWKNNRHYSEEEMATARIVLHEIMEGDEVMKAVRRHPLQKGGYIAKHTLVAAYNQLIELGEIKQDPGLLSKIRMKPIRSLSGVTTVTVLTKPHPCPGECIFCPDDEELPKSYLKLEPGAARAYENEFDPYQQVASRIASYEAIGHPTSKIELLILGGSWTAYPEEYRAWFVQRCLDAMNEKESRSLEEAQKWNEEGKHRNVGLVVETRPDAITAQELASMRRMGVTKVQIGVQSFNDHILEINKRGHPTATSRRAAALLRAAGFKIVMHWMPNLLGATITSDKEDFAKMWADGYSPDELKIYPTQLVENSALYQYWLDGKFIPYTTQQLIDLISDLKTSIPEYCRVNRIIRDIPATYIVAGSKRSSLRQDVHREMEKRGERCRCIRCREVRGKRVSEESLLLKDLVYRPNYTEEHFLNYSTTDDRLAGYLRLSFPDIENPESKEIHEEVNANISELEGCAIIRELHIYGQSLQFGTEKKGAAQHAGLGSNLLEEAAQLARAKGYKKIAVISAIGTRKYYRERGFTGGNLYMIRSLE